MEPAVFRNVPLFSCWVATGNGCGFLNKLGTPGSGGKKNIDGFKVSLLVIIPMIQSILCCFRRDWRHLKTIGFLYRWFWGSDGSGDVGGMGSEFGPMGGPRCFGRLHRGFRCSETAQEILKGNRNWRSPSNMFPVLDVDVGCKLLLPCWRIGKEYEEMGCSMVYQSRWGHHPCSNLALRWFQTDRTGEGQV